MMLVSRRIPLPISCISGPLLLGCYDFRRILWNFSPLRKMDRSKRSIEISQAESLSTNGNSAIHRNSVMAGRLLLNTSSDDKDTVMVGSVPIFPKKQRMKYSQYWPDRCGSSTENNPGLMSMPDPITSSQNAAGFEHAQRNRRTRVDLGSNKASINKSSFGSDTESNSSHYVPEGHKKDSSVSLPKCDICRHVRGNSAFRGESVPAGSKEHCTELPEGGTKQMILRPGMVLLKHYLNHNEQVKIVKNCRELGLGPGGFYRPGYKDGAKLRLQMMCLGLDWDPQSRNYGNIRQIDGTKPPNIPGQFSLLVKRAIQDAHSLIEKESHVSNVEDILPSMSPNICIVNFYTTNGRLGLHQDRDESRESLRKGLPVVSFSIGDSAEFLYGDQRYVEEADQVLLESGDVLIFGGESRHVFHGVSSIMPNTAPKLLLNDTGLRHGRLNLTFREF